MIDLFTIFHRGGVVLYQRQLAEVPGEPVNTLISDVLLEERIGKTSYCHADKYTVKWTFANDCDLVFVAVYLNLANLLYIDDFLARSKERFTHLFRDAIRNLEPSVTYTKKFNRVFDEMLQQYEGGPTVTKQSIASENAQVASLDKRPQHTLGKKKPKEGADDAQGNSSTAEIETTATGETSTASNAETAAAPATTTTTAPSVNTAKLAALQQAARTGKPVHSFGPKKKKGPAAAAAAEEAPASDKKKGKAATKWNDTKLSKEEQKELDYSAKFGGDAAAPERLDSGFKPFTKGEDDASDKYGKVRAEYSDDDEPESEPDEEEAKPAAASGGGIFSFFKTLVAGKMLERSDLEPVLEQFKDVLNSKNVAADISEQLAESVIKTLEGQKLASFTSVKSMVKKAVEEALTRILTPNRQIDVLAGVLQANEQKRPYSICFVGVNGVGKSTSLAKTAKYFLSKDLSVGIAACDTFRAGAIEQLRTHAKRLSAEPPFKEVPLYARGYDRDAADVAQDAIGQARRDGMNVVLIDTAGRMQHNEPLMRALAKLITVNKPDLVLFVGEALVGADAVDQVREFNRALSDMSEEKKPRLIDAIILTKFDTIDDKVGAAISMAYVTGQPILFVGTGQDYSDLKRMNVKTLIRALLK